MHPGGGGFYVFGEGLTGAAAIHPAVEINWVSSTNGTYQVQGVASLTATNWINLGEPVVATGARFYRVLPVHGAAT